MEGSCQGLTGPQLLPITSRGGESFTPPQTPEKWEALFWDALVAAPCGAGCGRDPHLRVLRFLLIYTCRVGGPDSHSWGPGLRLWVLVS